MPIEQNAYWWKTAKIYELYIDQFAGNIQGLIAKLDYFTALGVDCLHLLPHYPSGGVDQGYDITDYRTVRAELGTLDDFKHLVTEARARGIRIITDFVLNHTSMEHPWFLEASASRDNPKRDFYLWNSLDYGFEGATNAFPDMKPSNWIANPQTEDYYFATFYPEQPDLNWDNPEVEAAMLATMDFWADLGVSGFRLDAAQYLIKRENTTSRGLPETHAVLKRIRTHLDEKYPGVVILAEADQGIQLMKEYFGKGDECHLCYHFPLMSQLWLALTDDSLEQVHKTIEQSFDIPDNCQWATFLRNHDEISLVTLPSQDRARVVDHIDPAHRYVMEKMGLTAVRVATAFGGDPAKIRAAFELLYSLPGAPVMYYGDEIGLQNLPVRPGVTDTRLYVRGNFDWQEADRQQADASSLWSAIHAIISRTTIASPITLEPTE